MVEATIKFKYPETLEDIKVSQYMKYASITQLILKQDEPNYAELTKHKMSIFCNIPISAVDMAKAENILDVSEHLDGLLNEEIELVTSFKLGDREYKIIPNFTNMSFGEYVDLAEFFKSPDNYHRAISVVYREVEEEKYNKFLDINQYKLKPYDSDEASEIADKFKDIPATVIVGLSFFFQTSLMELQKISAASLQEEMLGIRLNQ